ncbi:YaaA family protein [Sulfurimonas diazotrophicus]|uniref:YaaA family protein n=1 Tax=Sulfurimonas diazotrophicus TaxID=3131939 RepID=A0ABZ3HAB1_9BACT
MIFTLFSPSEGKRSGGDPASINNDNLLFGLASRKAILDTYNGIVGGDNLAQVLALFGLKKAEDARAYIADLYSAPTLPAVERYDGVAYDYLDYPSLEAEASAYLQERLIIFSNLFGPLRGGDLIPTYKVKQGNTVGGIAPERYYKDTFNAPLDALIGNDEILDLRAGYYDKFFKPTNPVTTMKFMKEGKVVSHWAKAYRGIVLRHLSQHRYETIDALLASQIPGLACREILEKKGKREAIFDIIA